MLLGLYSHVYDATLHESPLHCLSVSVLWFSLVLYSNKYSTLLMHARSRHNDCQTEKWQEMASYFDADGDGEISWDEFTRGFINFARELPDPIVFPVIGATFTECVQHLQDTVNSRVVALCEQFYERFKHDQN